MMISATQRRHRHSYLLAALLVAATGCGDATPSVVPVRGKVTFNGQPLTTGRVTTLPAAGRGAGGEIQPDGTFELTTFADGDGAVPGMHKVAVRAYDDANVVDPEISAGKSLIPPRYANPETSGLSLEVTTEGDNMPALELTSP